jgi:hypothetical protein
MLNPEFFSTDLRLEQLKNFWRRAVFKRFKREGKALTIATSTVDAFLVSVEALEYVRGKPGHNAPAAITKGRTLLDYAARQRSVSQP